MSLPFARVQEMFRRISEDGPDLTINAHKKLSHEATELMKDTRIDEAADVYICLVGVMLRHGWSEADLSYEVYLKANVNEARVWAQEPDGTWQHVPGAVR